MKKLLALALLPVAFGSLAHAELTTEQLAERYGKFLTMEKGHKSKWFDFKKSVKAAKFDMEKKHHNEIFDLKKKELAGLGKTKDVNAYLNNTLNDMAALHRKQIDEQAAFGKAWHEKARALGEAENAELVKFTESLKE